jgi:hypothetical protein
MIPISIADMADRRRVRPPGRLCRGEWIDDIETGDDINPGLPNPPLSRHS